MHHDVGTYNTVLRPDGSFAVIDFDFASPGQPVEDLAYVLWSWTPLWHDDGGGAPRDGCGVAVGAAAQVRRRARRVCRGRQLRAQVPDAVLRCMTDQSPTLEELAAQGDPAFVRMVAEGHAERPRLDAAWFAQRRDLFEAAVT